MSRSEYFSTDNILARKISRIPEASRVNDDAIISYILDNANIEDFIDSSDELAAVIQRFPQYAERIIDEVFAKRFIKDFVSHLVDLSKLIEAVPTRADAIMQKAFSIKPMAFLDYVNPQYPEFEKYTKPMVDLVVNKILQTTSWRPNDRGFVQQFPKNHYEFVTLLSVSPHRANELFHHNFSFYKYIGNGQQLAYLLKELPQYTDVLMTKIMSDPDLFCNYIHGAGVFVSLLDVAPQYAEPLMKTVLSNPEWFYSACSNRDDFEKIKLKFPDVLALQYPTLHEAAKVLEKEFKKKDLEAVAVIDGLVRDYPPLLSIKSHFMYNSKLDELFIREAVSVSVMQRMHEDFAPEGTCDQVSQIFDQIAERFGSTTRKIDAGQAMFRGAVKIVGLQVTDAMRAEYVSSAATTDVKNTPSFRQ